MIREKLTLRKRIYIFFIVAGIMYIFMPYVVHADLFGYDLQDVYQDISTEVHETNEILEKTYQVSKISPFTIFESLPYGVGTKINTATKTVGLAVATLLLMVDFFKKTVNFEWSSRWENVLLFLIKIIAVKQIIQNADVISAHVYALFNYINTQVVGTKPEFLPEGTAVEVKVVNAKELLGMISTPFWSIKKALGFVPDDPISYLIYPDAVKMFYPNVDISPVQITFGEYNTLAKPKDVYQATVEKIFLTPYFLFMKAIAYFIFVIVIGRTFELCVYTIFAPLPLCTFASDTTQDVAKNFLKNYIAVVLQMAVIAAMFSAYSVMMTYLTGADGLFKNIKMVQILILAALALGVGKSGEWSRRICGA